MYMYTYMHICIYTLIFKNKILLISEKNPSTHCKLYIFSACSMKNKINFEVYTCGGFILIFGKLIQLCKVLKIK